ncbi:coniferyl aldehyde dehydrogenase [Marinobacter sp. S6332]|uniref:coniferyl aldehyde dehydrogenase n=1 Tax=Marinobacter sp. S6332 TaxID=2926403 RepID=UPI001FF324B6|nr:coniferyl aldehyde dehydrogenase [Marinobacter sp. S6332]MCK0165198.1 coniferyl aldehyde dehydrogenase [Marinobacter sp. S6332]
MTSNISQTDNLSAIFSAARAAHLTDPMPSVELRKERLSRLETALLKYETELVAAMNEDFRHRSDADSSIFDITIPLGDIRRNRRSVKRWMKPRRVGVPLHLKPARGRIIPQPKGVVGVISPWNFPVYLAVAPIAAALAAGNRVMLKPSELTPKTSDVMARMISDLFDPTEVSVCTGGVELSQAFSSLPFDHLFFTGSTRVGREVAVSAARNLTPVTLELGGKSPAILGEHASLDYSARRIAFGKIANAGQICVAPDYVLLPRNQLEAFATAMESAVHDFFPAGPQSPDYTGILNDNHLNRLQGLVTEAKAAGAEVRELLPKDAAHASGKMTPTLILNPPLDSRVMREEIFGPVLPLVTYDTAEEARSFVNSRPSPLALYVFSDDQKEREFWLNGTLSGGACVNETAFHVVADTMPFGGVGESGMGSYHGKAGFDQLSHLKSVLIQPKLNGAFVFNPPVSGFNRFVAKALRKIV